MLKEAIRNCENVIQIMSKNIVFVFKKEWQGGGMGCHSSFHFGRICLADGMVGCRVDKGKRQDTWNLYFFRPLKL